MVISINTVQLLSYQAKQNKNVLLFSTMHTGGPGHDTTTKPPILEHYNKHKAGVDVLDQMLHEYSSKRTTTRWPFVFFCNMLDVGLFAAYKIFILKFPTWNENKTYKRLLFLKEISQNLMYSHIIRRRKTTGLQKTLQNEIDLVIAKLSLNSDDEEVENSKMIKLPLIDILKDKVSNEKKRCSVCPVSIGRSSTRRCNLCSKPFCSNCFNKSNLILTNQNS